MEKTGNFTVPDDEKYEKDRFEVLWIILSRIFLGLE